jgi:hypothetical protein
MLDRFQFVKQKVQFDKKDDFPIDTILGLGGGWEYEA